MNILNSISGITLAVFLCVGCGVVGGCESTPKQAGSEASLAGALQQYRLMDYHAAGTQATEVMSRTRGADRADAAYLAGLCDYQAGHLEQANSHFQQAERDASSSTRAKARAMRGVICFRQKKYHEAATLLESSEDQLRGNDAREAAEYARQARLYATGSSDWSIIRSHSTSSGSTSPAIPGTGFTIQVGAYHQRTGAESAARQVETQAAKYGLGDVRIVISRDERGRTLHIVQVGSFSTRVEADSMRRRMGNLEYIVAPMVRSS